MVRSSGNINAPNWELTEACSRQPGSGACSLCEYVSLHLGLARLWKMKSRMRGSHCTSTVSGNAQEQEESCTGLLRNAGQALIYVARHVRQETRILPLDAAHCLVVFRLRDRCSFCFPLHGFQDRGEFPSVMSRPRKAYRRAVEEKGRTGWKTVGMSDTWEARTNL